MVRSSSREKKRQTPKKINKVRVAQGLRAKPPGDGQASQGKKTSSGQGCQTDNSTLKPGSVASSMSNRSFKTKTYLVVVWRQSKQIIGKLPPVEGWTCRPTLGIFGCVCVIKGDKGGRHRGDYGHGFITQSGSRPEIAAETATGAF